MQRGISIRLPLQGKAELLPLRRVIKGAVHVHASFFTR